MTENTNFKAVKFSERTPDTYSEYFTSKGHLKYDKFTKSFYDKDNSPVQVAVWFELITGFENSAKVLIQYLAENHHPHTTTIVTSTSAEMLEGLKIISNVTEFLVD